jgi:hypothetical protein
MTPAMIAALATNRKSVTGFFEIDFPSGTRRILIGSGEVIWGANTFKGYDPSFGSIVSGDGIAEETTGQAPNTSITVQVAAAATKSAIASDAAQLAPVKIWLAAIHFNASNHFEAVADPELLFDGFLDQATIYLDRKKDEVDYTIISAFDYFFEDSEGQRLSSAFQRALWPSDARENGLVNVTGVTRKIYWGTLGPNAASGATGSYGSAGIGSGGDPNGSYGGRVVSV